MIIGRALGRILEGKSLIVDSKRVELKFNLGNQDSLDKFIAQSDKYKASKYPLLFYVINPVKDFNGYKYC